MCWASVSARNGDSLSTTSPIASLTTSSKRDMCAPFWSRLRSTKQSSRAKNSSSRMRTTFSTPVTPTRESPTGTAGARAWTSSSAPRAGRCCGGRPLSPAPRPSLARDRWALAGRSGRRVRQAHIPDRRFWYHFALRALSHAQEHAGEGLGSRATRNGTANATIATHRRPSVDRRVAERRSGESDRAWGVAG